MTPIYGTDAHAKILGMLNDRYKFSARKMAEYYPRFKANEKQYQAYVPVGDAEKTVKEDNLKAFSVKVPYSMALLATWVTYCTTVFLGREPLIQVAASANGTKVNEMAVEAILNYQITNNGCRPHLFGWFQDTALYGFGTMAVWWDEEKARSSSWVEEEVTVLGIKMGKTKKKMVEKEMLLYAGNRYETISPYCVFPDPRVPLIDYQKGEFFGVETYPGWHELAARVGEYTNLEAAKKTKFPSEGDRTNLYSHLSTSSATNDGGTLPNSIDNKKVLRMSVMLVPKDWDLGTSTKPEKWLFEVVNDAVVIYAKPLGEMHSMHPFVIQTYEIDTHSLIPRGLMDILRDSSALLNWLFDTHIYNVRKALNNMFIVDPARINVDDLTKGDAGRLIRIRPAYQGQGVESGIKQLQVQDVTQTHLADMKLMLDLMQKLVGINDNLLGQLHQGRKTASEVRTASSAGANRLQTQCRWMSSVGWEKFTRMMISNTQQYMTEEQKVRIAGGMMSEQDMLVKPEDIVGFYTYIPVDGTLPIDRQALAQVWQSFLKEAMANPQFAAKYDMVKIMAYIANLGGINNLKSFEIDPMSQGAIDQGVQAGQLAPMGGMTPPPPAPPMPPMQGM